MSLTNRDLWIDPAETEREGIQRFGHILLGAILFVVFSFLVWSYFASLDQITRGEGKVIPVEPDPGDPEPGRRHARRDAGARRRRRREGPGACWSSTTPRRSSACRN